MTAKYNYEILQRLFPVMCILCVVFSSSRIDRLEGSHSHDIEKQILKKIPLSEQKSLDHFFRRIIGQDQFGFALFGSKAVALTGYFPVVPAGNLHYSPFEHIRKSEFEAWKKYKHYFQSHNFLWFDAPFSPKIIEITLINKKRFLDVVEKHIALFQKHLHRTVTPEVLFYELSTCNTDILTFLNDREDLLGILLGFGEESAILYQRRKNLRESLRSEPPFIAKSISPSSNFSSTEEEYQYLLENMYTHQKNNIGGRINIFYPVLFMNLGTPEAEALIDKYERDQEKIIKIFHNKSFLKTTLKQIHSSHPICLDN